MHQYCIAKTQTLLCLKISLRDTLVYCAFKLKKSIQWNLLSNLVSRQPLFVKILSSSNCYLGRQKRLSIFTLWSNLDPNIHFNLGQIFIICTSFSYDDFWILLIIKGCPDGLILQFTVKPYVLLKNLFHWSFSNFYKDKHGYDFFWPQRSWRPLEAKNTPQRPKMAWRSWFIEKSV